MHLNVNYKAEGSSSKKEKSFHFIYDKTRMFKDNQAEKYMLMTLVKSGNAKRQCETNHNFKLSL